LAEIEKEDFYQERSFAESLAKSLQQSQADNSAMNYAIKSIHHLIHPHSSDHYSESIDHICDEILSHPHPGAPLQAELDQLRKVQVAAEGLCCEYNRTYQKRECFEECVCFGNCDYPPVFKALAQAKADQ